MVSTEVVYNGREEKDLPKSVENVLKKLKNKGFQSFVCKGTRAQFGSWFSNFDLMYYCIILTCWYATLDWYCKIHHCKRLTSEPTLLMYLLWFVSALNALLLNVGLRLKSYTLLQLWSSVTTSLALFKLFLYVFWLRNSSSEVSSTWSYLRISQRHIPFPENTKNMMESNSEDFPFDKIDINVVILYEGIISLAAVMFIRPILFYMTAVWYIRKCDPCLFHHITKAQCSKCTRQRRSSLV